MINERGPEKQVFTVILFSSYDENKFFEKILHN